MRKLWEESDCGMRRGEPQSTRHKEEADRRTPKSHREPENTYSAKGRKGFGAEKNLLTRTNTQKTGLVSTDGRRQAQDSLHVFFPDQAYLIYKTVKGL